MLLHSRSEINAGGHCVHGGETPKMTRKLREKAEIEHLSTGAINQR